MTFHHNLRRITAATALALATTLGAGVALAQPAGGPHGPGAGEQMIGHLIEQARAQLNLNTSQQMAFDTAVAHGKEAREKSRALHQNLKAKMQAELQNPAPNLAGIAAMADDVEQQTRTLRHQVRDEWLAFYTNSLVAEQKAIVADMTKKRMAHAETFRQRMREHFQQRFGGTSG